MKMNMFVKNEESANGIDLPLVPIIGKEFKANDREYSLGKVSQCEVGEYMRNTDTYGNDVVFIKHYDDYEDVLSCVYGWDFYLSLTDSEIVEKYNNLPWNRGILLYIS